MAVNRLGQESKDYMFSQCTNCKKYGVWVHEAMVYPLICTAPLPNADMPADVAADYNEARTILSLSPRGAAALLRLAIQKLCKHLGEKGENINDDIKELVKKGLSPVIQQALDLVRVVGNDAVHPGQIDLNDDTETAGKLFGLVNIIVQTMITDPREIQQLYDSVVPDGKKQAIAKRDGS